MITTPAVPDGSCRRVACVRLAVTPSPWAFATTHAEAIARHWQCRKAANPAFFNGRVFVLRGFTDGPAAIEATFSLENFADFLYWRDHDIADGGTLDGFGSALVRSAEGHVLLGRNAAGTLNAGKLYLPGGFLDARDVGPDGCIDLDASIARELLEETGLDATSLVRVPGIIVVRYRRYCAFVIEYRSALAAEALRAAMLDSLRRHGDRELTDIVVARDPADHGRLPVLDHARFLLRHVLSGNI